MSASAHHVTAPEDRIPLRQKSAYATGMLVNNLQAAALPAMVVILNLGLGMNPVLVGLMPLHSLRNASFLHNEIPGIIIPDNIMKRIESAGEDAPQEGVRIAQELAAQIKDMAGGLYLMPQFGRYDLAAEIIESVRAKQGV